MPLVLRNEKGAPLTNAEVDGNFTYLEGRAGTSDQAAADALQAAQDAATAAQGAQGTANAAGEAANGAQNTANSAGQAASDAQGTANAAGQAATVAAQALATHKTSGDHDDRYLKLDAVATAPAANKTPKADAQGKVDPSWLGGEIARALIPDPLRSSVEAASGGRMTVLYTAAGKPSYMHILPAFSLEDVAPGGELGTGIHPAFMVNGVFKRELFIGAYQASMIGAEAVSQPGVAPRVSLNFDAAKNACLTCGAGWHLMSNWEWAAIALWTMANGTQPRGNTLYGVSHERRLETGRRNDGNTPGLSSGSGVALCGSGPATWSHDGTPAGIHDLVGNVYEWQDGLRLQDGRVFMPLDNYFTQPDADWPAIDLWASSSSASATGTSKWETAEANVVRNGAVGDNANGFSDSGVWSTTAVNGAPPLSAKQALLVPSVLAPVGRLYTRSYGARFAYRGGGYTSASFAGLATLSAQFGRTYTGTTVGFRLAFAL